MAAETLEKDLSNNFPPGYEPPTVWEFQEQGGKFGSTNRPTAGARMEKELPKGEHALQLYSLATPNGVKVTILLEELCDLYPEFDYDAWLVTISGDQFGSGFVAANPNSKIPAMMDFSDPEKPIRIFESGAIMIYLAENFDPQNMFLPTDKAGRAECLSWVMWQMGSAPFVGGGFGHFYNYAPIKIEYAINRYAMETKRQMDVLDKHLADKQYICGDQYTIADMCIWPWYGALVRGVLYGAKEFLQVEQYSNVCAWAIRVFERPAVVRGRMVNRPFGNKEEQLKNRHSRSDFETSTEDKLNPDQDGA